MKRASTIAALTLLVVCLPACSRRAPAPGYQMVQLPPLIDLTEHELIGVLPVVNSSRGELGPLTTRKLMEWARRDQGIVRMIELGEVPGAPRPDGNGRWNPEAIKAFGRKHDLRTILAGEIVVSDVKPDIRVAASLKSGSVTALMDVSLHVELLEIATGASIWNSSAHVRQNVGHISVSSGRNVSFDASDPEAAYGGMVETLVEQVTRDFRGTWERRVVPTSSASGTR